MTSHGEEQAFDPPESSDARSLDFTATLVAWALAFSCAGTAAGAALVWTRTVPSLVPLGLGAAVLGAVVGALAWTRERQAAEGRPVVADGRGHATRPLGAWLLGVPLAVGVGGLLAMVGVGALHTGSLAVGGAFGLLALGFASLSRPLAVNSALTQAILAEAGGRPEEAHERWKRLVNSWWSTRSGRDQAALNLGAAALHRGDPDDAQIWYSAVRGGRARVFAEAGLALVAVLDGSWEAAEEHLGTATMGGRVVQREVDGVRLLMVLRRDGPEAAHELGERLGTLDAGILFHGVLAAARQRSGGEGADPGLLFALRDSGLPRLVPELRALLDGGG